MYATIAQWIEQLPSKQLAAGSSPAGCTLNPILNRWDFFISQLLILKNPVGFFSNFI
jgi:hypothetical protein